MRVFVTGGNGFIGSRVCERLHAEGHQIRCLLRKHSKTHRIDHLPFETHMGDVRDADSMVEGLSGCDAVIHLASLSAWEQIRSPLMHEIVIDGTTNVCTAAMKAGNLRTVFVSSVVAVGGTDTPEVQTEESSFSLPAEPFVYGNAKSEAETICRQYAADGLPVLIVNPCEVYGPQDDDLITASYLIDALVDWPAMSVQGGTAVAHVEDIAGGIVAALTRGRPGERYILGGENLTVRQVIDLTLQIGGKPDKFVLQLPNGLVSAVINAMAKLRLPTPVHPDLLAHAVKFWWVDCQKAKDELGYTHRSAKEALEDVVGWLKETGRV